MGIPFGIEETLCALTGFAATALYNVLKKKSAYSGIYKHAIFTAVGFYVGHLISEDINRRAKAKMVYLEDYVRLHPEDFVEVPRKWAHVMQPWYPIR